MAWPLQLAWWPAQGSPPLIAFASLSAFAAVNGYAVSASTTGLPYRERTSVMTL